MSWKNLKRSIRTQSIKACRIKSAWSNLSSRMKNCKTKLVTSVTLLQT